MSDNHASYMKIGLVLLLGAAALVGTLLYFGGLGERSEELLAETYSDTPVSGLSIGSEVDFRGVKVGQVRDISFVGCEYDDVADADEQKIYILIAFDTRQFRLDPDESASETLEYLINRGLRATVTASGITGMSRIELNFPKTEMPPATTSWKPRHYTIPPAPSMFASVSESLMRIMDHVRKMDLSTTWSNVERTVRSASDLATDANETFERQRASVDTIIGNLESASQSLKEFVSTIRENPSLLLRANDEAPLPETSR